MVIYKVKKAHLSQPFPDLREATPVPAQAYTYLKQEVEPLNCLALRITGGRLKRTCICTCML